MIKREAVTNNIVDDLNSRNENWDKLETMSNQLETEYEPRLTNAETNIVDLQQEEAEHSTRLDTAETNINGLLPKVDLATIDTQIGTSIQSKIADDSVVEIQKIEGATTVTPANPDLDISPDNVATITSAKDFDVVACGKNLLPNNGISRTTKGLSFLVNSDKSVTIDGTSTRDFSTFEFCKGENSGIFKVGETYTIISSGVSPDIAYIELVLTHDDGTISYIRNSVTISKKVVSYRFVAISRINQAIDNLTVYPQVELGEVATEYEPYKSNKVNIPYELNKLPNGVADTRERIDDKYVKYTHRIGKTTRATTGSIVDAKTNGQYICSVAPSGFLNGTTFTMPSGVTSAEILYELETPIETIVEEPSTLTSYKGVTNVFTTATAQPKLTVDFKSRLKNTTEILLAEIAKLKQAIISLGGTV